MNTKNSLSVGILVSVCIVVLACACSFDAQTELSKTSIQVKQSVIIREVKPATRESKKAPDKCLQTFREFFSYIQRSVPDITDDKQAQERWLSLNLRKAMAKKVEFEDSKAKENPTDKREYPANSSFVGAWDYPSTFAIVGSRFYEQRAVIDVLYEWNDKTNYPNTKRLSSFIFIKEGNLWKLDDIYSFRGEFNSAESLSNYFRQGR